MYVCMYVCVYIYMYIYICICSLAPATHKVQLRELEFTAPICQAECDPYPPGYMRTAAGLASVAFKCNSPF